MIALTVRLIALLLMSTSSPPAVAALEGAAAGGGAHGEGRLAGPDHDAAGAERLAAGVDRARRGGALQEGVDVCGGRPQVMLPLVPAALMMTLLVGPLLIVLPCAAMPVPPV